MKMGNIAGDFVREIPAKRPTRGKPNGRWLTLLGTQRHRQDDAGPRHLSLPAPGALAGLGGSLPALQSEGRHQQGAALGL